MIEDDSKGATIEPFKSLLGRAWGVRYCEVCKKRIHEGGEYLGDLRWKHKRCKFNTERS